MKFLHTADLHLKDRSHLSTVNAIIDLAERENTELIIIAGDLFDASANGRVLEAELLSIWKKYSGTVLVVPGNHDDKFLSQRTELAPNVIVANQISYSVAEIQGIFFVCVPYQKNISLSDINIKKFEPAVLITHGTYFHQHSGQEKYFPIKSSDLSGRYRYVALGHYHSWFDKWADGTLTVNPGAPRQTRKSDKGPRYVSLVDTNTWVMEKIRLAVSFQEYKTVSISLSESEQEICAKILSTVSMLQEGCFAEIELTVKGSILFSKYSLSERVEFWIKYLENNRIDASRISWNLSNIVQISPKILYSSFCMMMVDKIAAAVPEQENMLASFLFERLQHENQRLLD
ncbi:MAG: metallophosphoesterase family protein [Brevinemataceae bacterium]